MRCGATIIIGSICLFLAHPTYADPGPGVIIVTSKTGQHDESLATTAAEQRAREAGWQLVSKTFPPKEIEAVLSCFLSITAWPCVSAAIRDRSIGRVAAIALTPRPSGDGARQVIISERIVLASAQSMVVGQRVCDHCTDDALTALVGQLTKELLDRAALQSGRTALSIKATPPQSKYSIDGTLTGLTDAVIDIAPGEYTVTIEHEGFEPVTQPIQVKEGKLASVSVTLSPLAPGPTSTENPGAKDDRGTETRPSHRLPKGLMITGAFGVAIGFVVLAYNQHSVTAPRGQEQRRGYYDTVPVSLTFIATGVVVAGIGAYLWWPRSQLPTRVTPVVAPNRGGATIGVQKSF